MTSAKTLCISCTAVLLSSGAVLAQEACTTYTVVAGDNLRYIARSAYGDADLYRLIYRANVKTIGVKADLIEIGVKLVIPCDPNATGVATAPAAAPVAEEQKSTALITGIVDPAKQPLELVPQLPVASAGTVKLSVSVAPVEDAPVAEAPVADAPVAEAPVAEAPVAEVPLAEVPVAEVPVAEVPVAEAPVAEVPVAEAPVAEAPVAEAPVAEAPLEVAAAEPEAADPATAPVLPVRFVTGNGYAPFADEMMPGGGMFTQIVEMAIFRADPSIPYNLTFISDWQAHIDALLPSQAYDLSFPWVRPDCETPEILTAADLSRCESFEFSAPYYEIVDGFFALSDSDLVSATNYATFAGKRICRPEGYTTGVLDAVGLTVPNVDLLRPLEVTDCFEALADGKVDLVAIDAEVGDSAIAELGMVGDFLQNPHLMTLQSLHVIAHKTNPRAVEMVRMLDDGLIEMYESGEWYDIVSSALSKGAIRQ